jgi:hypothetical protein
MAFELELIPANRNSNTKKYKEMKTLFNDGSSVPTAFVTKGRQRVKQYDGNTVFLNNGDEFEIELFNPTTNKVLAKIELNGSYLGYGIVLRPGERVFLERYLNDARKFLFETYMVDKDNGDVMRAIVDNGKVDVKFYSETLNYYWNGHWSYTYTDPIIPKDITAPNGDIYSTNTGQFWGFAGASASSTSDVHCYASLSVPEKSNETGRIEKGSVSNQSFTHNNTSFSSWWSWNSVWKILPASEKPLEHKDLKVYCTNCGAKQKKLSHLYCPICGTKF